MTFMAEPAAERPPIIEASGLGLTYHGPAGPHAAVEGVDLDVHEGEFVSLISPPGCGKTSLLRLMADLERPTDGVIHVSGASAEEARFDRSYGYVFSEPALYPWRSALRNVTLPLEIMGSPPAERERLAREALAQMGLEGVARAFPWRLSDAERQRVSIARAISFAPDFLLMDEPFSRLANSDRDALGLDLLRLWREAGLTIIFVTDSISEAVFLSSRIFVMSQRPGRVIRRIETGLPDDRALELRDHPAFLEIVGEVRQALQQGYVNGQPA